VLTGAATVEVTGKAPWVRQARRVLACFGVPVATAGGAPGAAVLLSDAARSLRAGVSRVMVTPFGAAAPRRASELTLAAWSGNLLLTGEQGRPPLWPNLEVCAELGGLQGALATLARLLRPNRSLRADVSVWQTVCFATMVVGRLLSSGRSPERQGPRDAFFGAGSPYPSTLLRCGDGYVQVQYAPVEPGLLAVLTGVDELSDPALLRDPAAYANRIDELTGCWLSGQSRAAGVAAAQELRHPFAAVATVAELRAQYGAGAMPPAVRVLATSAGTVAAASQAPAARPLAGVRVLELSTAVAGPMAGALLAELGAQVVRFAHPVQQETPLDADKRVVHGDLSSPVGRQQFRALLQHTDLLLTNLTPRALANLGVAPIALTEQAPGLTSVAIVAYPTGDPRRLWAGFDPALQAATGVADLARYPAGPPLRLAGYPLDGATALWAACAAVAALLRRRLDGARLHLEVSMLGVGLHLVGPQLRGEPGWRAQALLADVFPAAGHDQWLALTVHDERDWQALRRLAPLLPADPAAAAGAVADWTARHDTTALAAGLQAAGIDAAPVLHPKALLDGEGPAGGLVANGRVRTGLGLGGR